MTDAVRALLLDLWNGDGQADRMVEVLAEARATLPADDPLWSELTCRLAARLLHRSGRGQDPVDRDAAIDLLSEPVDIEPERVSKVQALRALLLLRRAWLDESAPDLAALPYRPDGGQGTPEAVRAALGPDRLADVREAQRLLVLALTAAETPDWYRGWVAAMLGLELTRWAAVAGAPDADLTGPLARLAERPDVPGRAELDGLLRLALAIAAPDEETRIAQVRAGIAALPAGNPLWLQCQHELGMLYTKRANRTGRRDDMLLMPVPEFESLAHLAPDHPMYPITLRTAATRLVQVLGDVPDAEGADRAPELAVRLRELPDAGAVEDLLAGALLMQHAEREARYDGVAGAMDVVQPAVAGVRPETPLAALGLAAMGGALADRYWFGGSLEDLDAAIVYIDHALTAEPALDIPRHSMLSMRWARGYALFLRGCRLRAADDLRAGIAELEAVAAGSGPDTSGYARAVMAWGVAELVLGAVTDDRDRARRGAQRMVDAAGELPPDHPDRPALRAASGMAWTLLAVVATADGPAADDERAAALDNAIPALADRVDNPQVTGTARIQARIMLGLACVLRYDSSGDAADLDAAIDALSRAYLDADDVARHDQTAFLLLLLSGAYGERGDVLEAIETGMAALRAVIDDALVQTGTEHALAVARDTAARAHDLASYCLQQRDGGAAVQALELGRGLTLHLTTAVASVPDLLAAQGEHELAELWRQRGAPEPTLWRDTMVADVASLLVAEPPDDLRIRVRTVLGDAFTGAPETAEIAAALRDTGTDALVYLLPGQALLVLPDARTEVVPLDLDMSAPEPAAYLAALPAYRDGGDGTAWRNALADVCDWAWRAAIGPVLAHLVSPQRIRLVPCGSLGVIPWHASRDGDRYAVQRTVFSYAATARQFLETTRRAARPLAERPVLVCVGDRDLFHTRFALDGARERFYPHAGLYGHLTGTVLGPGTPDEILTCLPGAAAPASLVHIGAHARIGDSATDSAVTLSGGRLPVARILRQATGRDPAAPGPLVILGTCDSDLAGAQHDEALTLSTSFLAAGATAVIGTRWPVPEIRTAILMYMLHHGLATLPPADALAAAQRWMLDAGRTAPAGMPTRIADAAADLSDVTDYDLAHPASWAAVTHHGV